MLEAPNQRASKPPNTMQACTIMNEQRTRSALPHPDPRHSRGFTLTELMITVVVAAIIAAIAIPSYQDYTRNARRAAAVTMLTDVASRQEQHYLDNRSYANSLAVLGFPAATVQTDGGYYTVSVQAATATTYTLQAVPIASQQTADCGTLTVDHNQTKTPAACFTK